MQLVTYEQDGESRCGVFVGERLVGAAEVGRAMTARRVSRRRNEESGTYVQ